MLVQQGQVEEGLKYLRRAHARAAHSPQVRYHLAVALNLLGRTKEARSELKAALDSNQIFDESDAAEALLQTLSDS